jgi:hypothetical protein
VGGLADGGPSGTGTGGIFNIGFADLQGLPNQVRSLLAQAGVTNVPTAPKIDKDAPMTAAFLSGPQGTNGWYTGAVQVTLIATDIDGPSDIASTTYNVDGTGISGYLGPFTVSANGNHSVQCGSVDKAGNIETPRPTTSFKIDSTPPVITPQITGTLGNNGWYRSAVTVTWNVVDPESGIASSTGCTTSTLKTNTAGVTVTCSATNRAGLSSSVPVTIKIDQIPPVISGLPPAGCSLWPPNGKSVQVATVTAADAMSGLAPGSFQVTGTSNELIDPSDPAIVITPNGSSGYVVQLQADRLGNGNGRVYTLTAKASDLAGNTASMTATCTVPHDQGKN